MLTAGLTTIALASTAWAWQMIYSTTLKKDISEDEDVSEVERRRRTRKRRRGLRTKIVMWSLIPTALILSAVAALTFYAYRRVTEDLVLERNQDRTQLLAGQFAAGLQDYVRPLSSLANSPDVLSGVAQRQQAALERAWPVGDLALFDGGVLILDRRGRVTASVRDPATLVGRDMSRLFTGPESISSEALGFTNILTDVIPGSGVIALSRPVWRVPEEVEGTVVGLFLAQPGAPRHSQFYRDIWTLYIGRRESAYLVDGNGRVIFHPDTFFIGDDFSHLESVRHALSGSPGATLARDLDGYEVVAGYAPVQGAPWALITEESWAQVLRTSQPYSRFMLALLTLGVVVPVAVAALGVRRITDPIADLSVAAQEIAAGDFEQTINVQTGDELETLATQFNRMAAQLQASYAHLERRVGDRTRELAALNHIAAVVSRSLALEEVLGAALEQTMALLGMEAGAAFRLENEQALAMAAHRGLSEAFVRQVARLPLHVSIAAQAVGEARPVVRPVSDYPESDFRALLETEGLRLIIGVPLIAKGEILGVMNLATREDRVVTAEERALLASIGQQTGVAVENARLYEQAEASAAAAERNRLARELHDAVSQTLFSASLIADVLPRLWERDPDEARRRLATLRRLTRSAMAEMRTLLLELRPSALLKADLGDLLRQLAEAVLGRTQIEMVVELAPIPDPPPDVKIALYRIAQETLNNVVKHADAAQITVSARGLLTGEEGIELRVVDDGRGFDPRSTPAAGHFGLENIRERAEAIGAALAIESEPERGTCVSVVWKKSGEHENRKEQQ